MVYAIGYQPAGSSLPRAEVVEGASKLQLENWVPDGGRGRGSPSFSGWRVVPESVPKVIRRYGKRKPQDFENQWVATVSDRLRQLIEDIEPEVHQFQTVRYVDKAGDLLEDRWFWQVCNRRDSVHRELSDVRLEGVVLTRAFPGPGRWLITFDRQQIGDAKFWCDKHVNFGRMITDEVHEQLTDARITGMRFTHYEQA